ncbi:MAG TPA: ABC transporter permease [Candidatus Limnocylindrales bacterium]|nr:ABC transporter permease [Candidatus Limnocylindrales bacterium]
MTTRTGEKPGGRSRRLAAWLHAHPRAQLRLLLSAPLVWLVGVYIGSLTILLLNAFWTSDSFTGKVNPFDWSLAAFEQILGNDVYRTVALRTVGMALLVTVTDALLAIPIAYYMARVASPRARRFLVIAILMPLWASYLVKIFAWRSIFLGNGFLAWVLQPFGIAGPGTDEITNSWIVFSYLWLPYMILPIYTGLERVPGSLLEASADLGARAGTTFRRVVLPLVLPSLVAGSIFTFSLTLGDYIVPDLVSDATFIGNVIYDNSALGNFPIAAAYSLLPILIVIGYLLVARRLGAFDSL